jgi:hypothetical protein
MSAGAKEVRIETSTTLAMGERRLQRFTRGRVHRPEAPLVALGVPEEPAVHSPSLQVEGSRLRYAPPGDRPESAEGAGGLGA